MTRLLLSSFIIWVLAVASTAQYDHINILKGIEGMELFDSLRSQYKPAFTMSYGDARDTLYSKIDVSDSNGLQCIYTGFTVTLDPLLDPTTDAFNKGINAEHTYPQSKGASDGPGRSDMHHLRPSKVNVNSARGSFPFGESVDTQTDTWFRGEEVRTSIPNTNIDEYSELNEEQGFSLFEPRESVKGDIARGIFYFYTMYRDEAEAADPDFFEIQRSVLCDWHTLDPVDESEWNRNLLIASYQDDKPNPFILDCSMAARMYCDSIDIACMVLTSTDDTPFENSLIGNPYPNPTLDFIHLDITNMNGHSLKTKLISIHGTILEQRVVQVNSDLQQISIQSPEVRGVYYIHLSDDEGRSFIRKFTKL